MGIDLCAGAGGFSYGLERAGVKMKLGIEIDPDSALTLANNHKEMKVLISDIRNVDPISAIKAAGLKKKDVSIVAGGLPCQGFSESNKRTRTIGNPLNALYQEFFRFIHDIRPQLFVLENVAGLITLEKGHFLKEIISEAERLQYYAQWKVLDAQNYGIPQRRKRIVLIGTKEKAPNLLSIETRERVTVRDAIDDLPLIENGSKSNDLEYSRYSELSSYQTKMRVTGKKIVSNNMVTANGKIVTERYRYIPQGGNWRSIPNSLLSNYKNVSNCHEWVYYRLKWDSCSVGINNYRKNMLIHPVQDRGLSVREAARLQSFPDNYVFYGFLGSQQQQVANAVPPLLAYSVGKKIVAFLEDN